MLFVVIGSIAEKTRKEIMAICPRHKAPLDEFIAGGEVVGVGLNDPAGGSMVILRSRDTAEAFASSDPFLLERAVKEYQKNQPPHSTPWGDLCPSWCSSPMMSCSETSGNAQPYRSGTAVR